MDQVGSITILSVMLAAVVFSSVTLGMMVYVDDMQAQYGVQSSEYKNNATREAEETISKAGNMSSDLKKQMTGTTITGIDVVDSILGSLFGTFKNLTTTIPVLFTGMMTTATSMLGLPDWVGNMIQTIIVLVIVFLIARMFLKSGRLGG